MTERCRDPGATVDGLSAPAEDEVAAASPAPPSRGVPIPLPGGRQPPQAAALGTTLGGGPPPSDPRWSARPSLVDQMLSVGVSPARLGIGGSNRPALVWLLWQQEIHQLILASTLEFVSKVIIDLNIQQSKVQGRISSFFCQCNKSEVRFVLVHKVEQNYTSEQYNQYLL